MARPRKQKNGEHQPNTPASSQTKSDGFLVGGTVLHQKLCLSIDMKQKRVFGHSIMKIVPPESGIVGLHADNMTIGSILVNDEPTEFEFFERYQHTYDDKWDSISCHNSAADAACATYISSLDRESIPNLLISCCKATKLSIADVGCQLNCESTLQKSPEVPKNVPDGNHEHTAEQNIKVVHINYCIVSSGIGIHFGENLLCTNNQIGRAHCWFPCMDSSSQRCCYDLEFTVGIDFVAVSNGNLLYQILSDSNPPCKTYVYKLSVPVSAGWISLAVAPFEVFPDPNNCLLSHMCMPNNMSMLKNTVGFFRSTFSYYEDYLGTPFPFGSYNQVFVPPEISASSVDVCASMCICSSELLFDERVVNETINTMIKLSYALARQWFGCYILAESTTDEWLLDGLAGFLTDMFIKHSLGNNEARFRRYKANHAVSQHDLTGATALSSPAASKDLYGTQSIGLYEKIRSWKAVTVLQMLEKQMGPESFRKILQDIVHRAKDKTSLRTLSTREFRHLANKVGNLERSFLKDFFPRWVGSCGCPVLRLGLSYIKRKNMIELAVMRTSTATSGSVSVNPELEEREADFSWPGMMSVRVHELDGTYDHPSLAMSGEPLQLLEVQLHSRLASKRLQKPKKLIKADGSDDNNDAISALDTRTCMDLPLLWIRVDPEMEYLAEVHFHQPVPMWINQLEKDKDVVAQSEAITALRTLPHLSFSIISALSNFLHDSKAFWRVRIEAALALAHASFEDSDLAGLLHLIKFYQSRRYDTDIGLPKPNNFHDIPEYFVLEAIPLAVAMVRSLDKKSPREAIEFILQLLKYNDNNGNPYSDVYWLATLIQSIGELELGKQHISFITSLLKRLERFLQSDRSTPSYNWILTMACIQTLTQIGLKTPSVLPLVYDWIKSFRNFEYWKVRLQANKSLLSLEFYNNGLDAALSLFLDYLDEESCFRGQVKMAVHMMHLCEGNNVSELVYCAKKSTLIAFLRFLSGTKAFDNIFLRHYLFCILQIIAGRPPSLYGVMRVPLLPISDREAFKELKTKSGLLRMKISGYQDSTVEPTVNTDVITSYTLAVSEYPKDMSCTAEITKDEALPFTAETGTEDNCKDLLHPCKSKATSSDVQVQPSVVGVSKDLLHPSNSKSTSSDVQVQPSVVGVSKDLLHPSNSKATSSDVQVQPSVVGVSKDLLHPSNTKTSGVQVQPSIFSVRDAGTISINCERRVLKIRVKKPAAFLIKEGSDRDNLMQSCKILCDETDVGGSSSVSVDAPSRFAVNETVGTSNQVLEDTKFIHHGHESHTTASVGSAKIVNNDDMGRELQCTADSKIGSPVEQSFLPTSLKRSDGEEDTQKSSCLPDRHDEVKTAALVEVRESRSKEKKEKKHKEKKRKREEKMEDPEYLEKKRMKKEKKRKEKELAKKLNNDKSTTSMAPERQGLERPFTDSQTTTVVISSGQEIRPKPISNNPPTKFRIKIKSSSFMPNP